MCWIESYQSWFWWLAVASIVMLVASPLVAGWLVVRLPVDYFSDNRRHAAPIWGEHAAFGPIIRVAKNLLGVLLLIAGIVMLVVPGQGLLTIVAGVLLVDFPGKYRLERWLMTRKSVWRSINWLRRRARREPFASPE